MNQITTFFSSVLSPALVLIILILLLFLNRWIFSGIKKSKDSLIVTRQTISMFIVLAGLLAFILSLPIEKELKGQLLSFLGIIISAAIALSSTTVLGNLMAGLMNNSMKRYRMGDLINIGELTGRVTRKNIFHTEIQLEDSNFVTIPNLYMASNPVKLTRKTNTVISITVSLGYDVPQTKIEKSLKEAALDAGLTDPYVYIIALGDFSVSYKIHGFLEDANKFFSTTSLLRSKVMDHLHKDQIEIVSPAFMNQRRVDETTFIPKIIVKKEETIPEEKSPEELIFDKATEAEAIEKKKEYLNEIEEKIDQLNEKNKKTKDKEESEEHKKTIERLKNTKQRIEEHIQRQNEKLNEKKN
ncbi:MAG: mechanosensitive ion channel domain-containing protein [Bacteroidales bacterium]|jgi:small-conductance mechanosensitive channel|nr:mechanosensitive ion channel domain-containing protein [Bacteroidales bacterium]